MNEDSIFIKDADLVLPEHQEAVLCLLNAFATDEMGGGKALSETARRDLIPGLREHPTTLVFLAYHEEEPVGLAICFRGFSTFAARPLLYVSDFYVVPEKRGYGIGRLLMEAIEQRSRELGCCRLTLEVQENNHRARRLYAAAGFAQAVYGLETGVSLYMSKAL